ncbi:MAG: DUF5671 domain-containing protein [Chloroflexota bacterium]
MASTRRWYIYLVCAISIQSVTWAIIALLRNLFGTFSSISIAFKIAVILVGLPLFLVHWLWAQRLAARDLEERGSPLRRLYIYGTLASFLGPLLANLYDLLAFLLWIATGGRTDTFHTYSTISDAFAYHVPAILVMSLLGFYHWYVALDDRRSVPEVAGSAVVRRLFIYGFNAAGVFMVTMAIIHIIRWILYQFGDNVTIYSTNIGGLTDEVVRLAIGVPVWVIFSRWADRLFLGGNEEERESALRKFYLYAIIFVSVLTAVTNATILLAGFFRRLLDLPSQGDFRVPLPTVISMVFLWAYYAYVLKGDVALAAEAPRQAGIRRLYLYLIAAVGLAAFLVGLSGDISVLIQSGFGQFVTETRREALAWYTAAIFAGLPVWLIPWRRAQLNAEVPGPVGTTERRSVVRKIYLYFYLFVATMTVLSSMVYIVYQFLLIALGEQGPGGLLSKLGQAIAFSLIGVAVWLYHGFTLRRDGTLTRRDLTDHLSTFKVAVVDSGNGNFGRAMLEGIRRDFPDLQLDPIGLTAEARQTMGEADGDIPGRLASAGLITGPWIITLPGAANGAVTPAIAEAVVKSPARKLLVPMATESYEWVGLERANAETNLQQALRAVKQMLEGEEVRPVRPLTAGSIIGIIVGVIILLILLAIPLTYFFGF